MNAIDHAQQDDLARLTRDIARIESIFETWEETPRNAVVAYRTSVEALHAEALRRLIRALKSDAACLAALKEAVADDVVYAVLRRLGVLKPSLTERLETALESIRPMLASHGGDVELVSVEPPAVSVRFVGACDGCAASSLTFHAGVKKAVEDACPEITEIREAKGSSARTDGVNFISPFALHATGDWHDVCRTDDIAENGILEAVVGGERVILSRRANAVTCFQNSCAHLGLEIGSGAVADGIIICPHHGFQYDLTSGECLTAPEVQLQAHAVRVIGIRVEVRLSR
jgi:nitrite reductase/ring-hydroxylating ferredoxin subunit/Fe-S cluster biogenesis protein NfuA